MKTISILVPEFAVMQAIADPRYLFTTLNRFMESQGRAPLFHVQLVGAKRDVVLGEGMYTVHTDHLVHEVQHTDLIFIPAVIGDFEMVISKNKALLPWIEKQYHHGAEVASLCVGAFVLAATGLLNGKKCSTHWGFVNEFKNMFPGVELVDGAIITEDNRLYSSGGANSYWNLLLHLAEKYTNRETAILASKYFAIDIDRDNQSAFAIFRGQKDHKDDLIRKAQEFIENNVNEKIMVNDLADRFAVGRRSFERRFKQATGNSTLEYMQRVKMEAAKRRFETSQKNISEVMYDVGYTDTKAFRTVFKKITGLTPVEYRNKYNKMTAMAPA